MEIFIGKIIYLFILAVFLAILEIQIEGKHGWAQNLPAWRPKNESFIRIYKKIFADKDPTGYHIALNLFLLLFFHIPFIWGLGWSIYAELELLALYVMFVIVWDFLWFVLNPHYSLHKDFNSTSVWWHKRWALGLPVDYYAGFVVSFLLFIPAMIYDIMYVYKFILGWVASIVLTLILIFVYPKAY